MAMKSVKTSYYKNCWIHGPWRLQGVTMILLKYSAWFFKKKYFFILGRGKKNESEKVLGPIILKLDWAVH